MKQMLFGVATIDITPPVGVTLMGYEPRISESVGHPLRAEALACDDGCNGGWIMICADVCAFCSVFTNHLRREISEKTGLPVEAIIVTPTHTHSGPHVTDIMRCERSELESAYFRSFTANLIDVGLRAWQRRSPGSLVAGQTSAPDLGSNRRAQRPDGTWTNVWSDPEGLNKGYFDATVDLAGVRRPDGSLDALLVNYGCHPVGFGSKYLSISGDYVSYLKDSLEDEGHAGTVLFTVGGHANVDPRRCVQTDEEVVRTMGRDLAGQVAEALKGMQPVAGNRANSNCIPWEFSTTWDLSGRWAINFPHACKGSEVRTSVCAWGAGDLAFVGLPGETVSEYRALMQKDSPFERTIMVSLANDSIGYLPTDEILRQGAYEANLAPLRPLEKALIDKGAAALAALHKKLS